MVKKGDKKGAKAIEPDEEEEKSPQPTVILEPECPADMKTITITIIGLKNVVPLFSATDLVVTASYLNETLGETSKIPVTTDDSVLETRQDFHIQCDFNSPKEVDKLISNPVVMTVVQHPGAMDSKLYFQMRERAQSPILNSILSSVLSSENVIKMEGAFSEEKVETRSVTNVNDTPGSDIKPSKKPQKEPKEKLKSHKVAKVGSDTKKKSKEKMKEIDVTTDDAEVVENQMEPVLLGTCVLDLVPFFLGFQTMEESLPILSEEIFYDDRMVPQKMMPHVMVSVKLDSVWMFIDKKSPNILSFTVESMYNLPSVMGPEMQYEVSVMLPDMRSKNEPVTICDGRHTVEKNLDHFKKWPELAKKRDLTSVMKYRVNDEIYDIRNKVDVDLEKVMYSEEPRIEWNILKRNFLLEDAQINFRDRLRKYRHIALEIFMKPDMERELIVEDVPKEEKGKPRKNKSDKSSKSSKGGKKDDQGNSINNFEFTEYLHLMAVVDVSSLLYPGVNKARVACPLTTYHDLEAFQAAGLEDSHFMPKKVESLGAAMKEKDKKAKDKNETSARESSKGSKRAPKKLLDNSEPYNLEDKIPPPVVPPEPSKKVYNENGQPTFIVVEFELLHPIYPKRELEDLSVELEQMVSKKPQLPKVIITSQFASQYYYEIIRELIADMDLQYTIYIEEAKKCQCIETNFGHHTDFMMFLRRNGIYQKYLSSLTKAAAVVVNDKFSYQGEFTKSSAEFQNFVSEVYVHLVSEMNVVFNQIITHGLDPPSLGNLAALDSLLLYAKEACELCADALADKYYLERIARDERNSDYWFDYAVFHLEIEDFDKAVECVNESLSCDIEHKYSLLLYGILLTEKEKYAEAETCLLTVLLQQPRWVEGWGVLFLFYQLQNNEEGADLCFEMAQKYFKDPRVAENYFAATDDLAWSKKICPDTIFIQTAVLLIKMRAFKFAEQALSLELTKHAGIVHYLLGVIDYYKCQYEQALLHLQEAKSLHGSDFAVASILGHVLMAMGFLDEAKVEYLSVVESYNRPEDIMHMVYINLGIIYELKNNLQDARKLLLLVCKYSPTPYSWLAAGLLYYKQKDLLSAEECLTEANLCDNRLPEIWAYLAIINVQLDRIGEAELCYRQAIKNNLTNTDLLDKIEVVAAALGKHSDKKSVSISV